LLEALESRKKAQRRIPVAIASGVIGLVCLIQLSSRSLPQFELAKKLEWISYDLRMKYAAGRPQPYATNVLAAAFITDTDLKSMNDGSFGYKEKFPWPTHYYGQAVRELARQKAKVVGFDILFDLLNPGAVVALPDGTKMESDAFFALQLRQAGNVVLSAEIEGKILPADLFGTNASATGNIFTQRDADGVLRRAKPYSDFRLWHPVIRRVARALELDLSRPRFEPTRIVFPSRVADIREHSFPLTEDGRLRLDEIVTGEPGSAPEKPYTTERIWNLGIVLASRMLGLDLEHASIEANQIVLRGPDCERRIPLDSDGFFYIDWSIASVEDPRITSEPIAEGLIRPDHSRFWQGQAVSNESSPFSDKLVVIGSTATGGNVTDLGATPLIDRTPLVMKHLNVANSIIVNRFIRVPKPETELVLIVVLGILSAVLTWNLRVLIASVSVLALFATYLGLAVYLFAELRYWLPLVLPLFGGLLLTHFCMVTYRVLVEQKERQRIKSVFSKIVSPNVVNELLKAESISLGGARRRVSVYFADIRGFTRVTDENQAKAEEYVRTHKLPPAVAEAYLDTQAGDVLATVNLYLSVIADKIKKHNGTLDKYIGDCVMAFWGAPTPNERHAVDCVRAAIDAQCAIYELNLQRAAENKRRERENEAGKASGQVPLPMLTLLALGSGVNTGDVTVGLMGSDAHILNYTVFGREVNLASRLEGVSGRGRIIVSDSTYRDLKRFDPDLAATCEELPTVTVKGIRDAVQIYEVKWREIDTEMQSYDTSILTGRRVTLPTDVITPDEE